jgi:predicted acylesterase/phospholipase RssA
MNNIKSIHGCSSGAIIGSLLCLKVPIDDIRDYLEGNDSGVAYFYGIVKLKPRKKNNGDPINYFVDYVLTINDTPQDTFEGVDYERTKKEEKAAQSISGYFQGRFKDLQKDKRKRARAAKKARSKKPENQNDRMQNSRYLKLACCCICATRT